MSRVVIVTFSLPISHEIDPNEAVSIVRAALDDLHVTDYDVDWDTDEEN